MRPDQFTDYLLSKEIGFSTCNTVDVPFNASKGMFPSRCYLEPHKCGLFSAYRDVQTNFYRYNFMVYYRSQYRE